MKTRHRILRTVALAAVALVGSAACSLAPSSAGPAFPSVAPAVTVALVPSATASAKPTGTEGRLAIAPLTRPEIGLYDLLELEILTEIVPSNPFDPGELDLRVEFTAPSGRRSEIGGFWYRAFRPPAAILGEGPPSWRARFTPTEVGPWTAVANTPGARSEPLSFQVTPSEPGHPSASPQSSLPGLHDGDFFFPIGVNMGCGPERDCPRRLREVDGRLRRQRRRHDPGLDGRMVLRPGMV
jgi:hypothetical protein